MTPGRWDRKGLWGKARSRWVRALGASDQVVDWYRPYVQPAWLTRDEYASLPKLLRVCESRYTVDRPWFRVRSVTLVTTLRHLKTTLEMDVLHCQTEAGVLKEMALFALLYNLVQVVMAEAGPRQGVSVERISFVDMLRWLTTSPPVTSLPRLVVHPKRPDRVEPRCQKRRGKNYPFLIKPRAALRQRLRDKQDVA